MKLLNDILNRINTLENENETLKIQVKSLESKVEEIKEESEELNAIISPKRTQTLDTNNIWMGTKSGSGYQHMAKLRVYYDEVTDEWYSALPPGLLDKIIGNKVNSMLDDPETFEDLVDLQEYEAAEPDKVVTDITITGSTLMVHKSPPYAIYYPNEEE